jgi:hypothetical protein
VRPPGSSPVFLPSRDAKHNLVLVSMLHFHSHIDVKGDRRGRDRIVVGFQQYFRYIVAVSLIGGGNRSSRRKHHRQVTDKLYHIMLY